MKILIALLTVLASNSALACKLATPPSYDASAGAAESPPALRISSVAVSLGRSYGSPGQGDCAQLGTVEIALAAPDGSVLDGRFGARLVVTSGELPAAGVDLTTWIAPIKGNKVILTIADDKPAVDFTVAVQAVNAMGTAGEQSEAVQRARSVGCSAVGGLPLCALALLAATRARGRRFASPPPSDLLPRDPQLVASQEPSMLADSKPS